MWCCGLASKRCGSVRDFASISGEFSSLTGCCAALGASLPWRWICHRAVVAEKTVTTSTSSRAYPIYIRHSDPLLPSSPRGSSSSNTTRRGAVHRFTSHFQDTTPTHLDERLNLAPLRDLLGTHALRDLSWVSVDAGDDGVGVWALLCALIRLLEDDCLAAGVSSGEDLCGGGGWTV